MMGLLAAAVLVTGWGPALPAAADPTRMRPIDRGADRQLASVDVVPVTPADQSSRPVAEVAAPKVTWPSVDTARTHEVPVSDGARKTEVPGTGLRVAAVKPAVTGAGTEAEEAARGPEGHAKQGARVRPMESAAVERLGGAGMGYVVEGEPGSVVQLELDYAPFGDAVGADWGGRLRWLAAPGCALETPELAECQQVTWLDSVNDPDAKTLAGEVTLAGGSMVVMAAGAPTSSAGDFTATSLSSSSTWAGGGSTGAFIWNYPMRTPPVPGRLSPALSIGYSSAEADGRTSGSNNQPSWLGEGFDLSVGFIERRYAGCADEVGTTGANNATKTGDLCWLTDASRTNSAKWDNATLSLGGRSGELVRVANTAVWRLKDDDGTRVEKVGTAGATSGEYWKVTTTDGTQYFFGKGASDGLPGTATNSVWKVPVAGNHVGEPAYNSAFASSFRSVAWRWNLDYVVSPDGDSMTYRYTVESNKYRQNLATTVSYHRGGYLSEIKYGERQGAETATPSAKVMFSVAERCFNDTALPDCAAATPTTANAYHWPDVPVDSICTGTTCTVSQTAPTFFTRKRLTEVNTSVLNASAAYEAVDRWTLTAAYPQSGDGSPNALWLSSVQHSGRAGTAVTLPAVTFTPSMMVNRVTGLAYGTPLTRARLTTITLESGGKIEVGYLGSDCTASSLPTDWNNAKRCYPAYYSENGSPPTLQWFNKYVVNLVLEQDTAQVVNPYNEVSATGAVAKRTAYSYQGTPAWRYDDSLLTPAKYRTWNIWRGFGKVTTVVGDGGTGMTQTVTEGLFFRGMHGDKTNTSATKNVTITDSQAGTWTDHDYLAGVLRESRQLTVASGGTEISGEVIDPYVSGETANDGRKAARVIDTQETRTRQTITGKPVRKSTTKAMAWDTTYPWLVTQMQSTGDEAVTGDEQCVRTSHASNATAWLIGLPSETSTMPNLCATPLATAVVIDHTRTFYDGSTTLGQVGTRGLATRVDQLTGSTTRVWKTTATTVYDLHARPTSSTNVLGQTGAIAYASTSGLVTSVTATSADPDGTGPRAPLVTTTTFDPRWGTAIKRVDPGGQTTEATLDALGRVASVWLPGRAKTLSASQKFTYKTNDNGVNRIKTENLRADGTYAVSFTVRDSLLRDRQTQTESSQASGRVITDQRYDSRGLPTFTSNYWTSTGAPDGKLVEPSMLVQIPSVTTTTFDAAERPLVVTLSEYGYAKWNTSHAYTGDQIKVTPPAGGTPTTTTLDIRGRTTALTRHLGTSPAATGTTTSYTYTPAGKLASIIDAQGNVWSYTYDLAGNMLTNSDPDKGTTTNVYDLLGNITSSTDARGQGVKTIYDALNRPTKTTDLPGTTLTTTVWDTVKPGLVTSTARQVGSVQVVNKVNSYDVAGRATSTSLVVPTVADLIPSQLAGTYTTTQTYNIDGSVNTQSLPTVGPVPAETLTTAYDAKGNAATLTGVSGSITTGYVTYASYTPLGEPNIVEHGVASGGWLGGQTFYEASTRRVIGIDSFVDTAGGDLELGTLTYDPAGNITKTTAQQGAVTDTQCYRYDYLQQLATAWTPASGDCVPNPTQAGLGGPSPYWKTWTIDVVGNITQRVDRTKTTSTTTSFAHPAAGQPRPHFTTGTTSTGSSPGTRTFSADVAGNTTARTQAGQAQTLAWDAEGKQSTVTVAGSQVQKNLYDAVGNRIIRREIGKTTLYTPAGELTVTHSTNAMSSNRYYVFNNKTIALRTGAALSTVTYMIGDHQDTTHVQVNAQTRTASTRWSAPYGMTRTTTGGWAGERDFVGGTKDAAVGLVHIGARDYDADLNQFITTDPILKPIVPASHNAYSYAHNNPTTLSDPTGLDACPDGCEEYGRLYGRGAAIEYQQKYNEWRIEQLNSSNTGSGNKKNDRKSDPLNYWGKEYLRKANAQDKHRANYGAGILKAIAMAPIRSLQGIAFLSCLANDTSASCEIGMRATSAIADPYEKAIDDFATRGGIDTKDPSYAFGDVVGSLLLILIGSKPRPPAISATKSGSALADASAAAFKAADGASGWSPSAKHLAGAGGRWQKFADGADPAALAEEALRSPRAIFLPDKTAGRFIVETDLGRSVGTKGETWLKVVVSDSGDIITGYPVKR